MNKDDGSRVLPPTPEGLAADELERFGQTLIERARSMRQRLGPPSDAAEIRRVLDLVGYELVEQ